MSEMIEMCCVDCVSKKRKFCETYGLSISEAIEMCAKDNWDKKLTREMVEKLERIERAADKAFELMKNGATVDEALDDPSVKSILHPLEAVT